MKSLAIDLSSLDDNFSGLERFALEISKNIIAQNSKYKIYLIFKNKVHKDFLNIDKSKFESIVYNSKSRLVFVEFIIPKIIRKYKFDYIYFPAFPPSILLRKKAKTKIITMIHDLVAWDVPETMTLHSKIFFKISIKRALKTSCHITTNSIFTMNRIIDKFKIDKNKVTIVSMGARSLKESSINLDDVLKKYNIKGDYYITVGTLEPRKNFIGLIGYFNKLEENDCELVVVGRLGWKNDELKARLTKNDKIKYLGFVSNDDLAALYKNAKSFLFFSKYEGFGIPIIESISNGVLPIASNIPTNYEILGENYPFIFDVNSFESFSEKMKVFVNFSEKDKNMILTNLNQKIEKIYTWEHNAKKFLSILDGYNVE